VVNAPSHRIRGSAEIVRRHLLDSTHNGIVADMRLPRQRSSISVRLIHCCSQGATSTMKQFTKYQDLGKAAFRLMGTCVLLLCLFWNPLVLPPRFWSVSVFAYLLVLDATLLVGGIGLIYLRKWAALLSSALGSYLAFSLATSGDGSAEVVGIIFLLLPLFLAVAFWRNLVWGNKRRDPFLAFTGVMAAGLIVCVAFVIDHP
jgi:hypothetical protein